MTKTLCVLLSIFLTLTMTVPLMAQTVTPVLSQGQQDFIKALCLTLLSDPETPGDVLAPGLTADRFCDARVADAFLIANWTDLLAKHNLLTLVATDNQTRIIALEAATTVDVVALEARVVLLETQVATLEAALVSVKTALNTP